MNLVLSLVCDDARVRPDGKLDVTGVFNELYAPGFPAVQDRLVAVFVLEWERDVSGRRSFRADLVDDDGEKTLTIEGHTDVEARPEGRAPARTRIVMPLERVIFPHAGGYRFLLEVDGASHTALSLFVGLGEGADPDGGARV